MYAIFSVVRRRGGGSRRAARRMHFYGSLNISFTLNKALRQRKKNKLEKVMEKVKGMKGGKSECERNIEK